MEYLGTGKPINNTIPLVSVCVTAYRHERFLKKCLDGILMQKTDFPFEIVIGEDDSPDNTRKICKDYAEQFPDKIRLILRHRKDVIYIGGRPTGTFNFIETLKAARGKYVALCDGDDYWTDPEKLQKQVDFMEKNPDYVLTFHDTVLIDEYDNVISDTGVPPRLRTDGSGINMIEGKWLPFLTVMFRNHIIQRYPDAFYKVLNEDTFLYTLLGHYGGAKFLPDILPARYRKHPGSEWNSLMQYQQYEQLINTQEQLWPVVDKKYRWAIKESLFKYNIFISVYADGLGGKIKQYCKSYKYLNMRRSFFKKSLQVHAVLFGKLVRRGQKKIGNLFTSKKTAVQ